MSIGWIIAIIVLGAFMAIAPKLVWKIDSIFTAKRGEANDTYLITTRVFGILFLIAGIFLYLRR